MEMFSNTINFKTLQNIGLRISDIFIEFHKSILCFPTLTIPTFILSEKLDMVNKIVILYSYCSTSRNDFILGS